MSSTIQVSRRTLELLKRLKEIEGSKTYEHLILKLIGKATAVRVSNFGKYPRLRSFRREEIDRLD